MTDAQIMELMNTHIPRGFHVEAGIAFARALISASIADTAGAKPNEQMPKGFGHWFIAESAWNHRGANYDNALHIARDAWNAAIRYAATPAPSVADAAGASAIAALRSARHAIYMARNVNEAFDAVEALIVETIAKESSK